MAQAAGSSRASTAQGQEIKGLIENLSPKLKEIGKELDNPEKIKEHIEGMERLVETYNRGLPDLATEFQKLSINSDSLCQQLYSFLDQLGVTSKEEKLSDDIKSSLMGFRDKLKKLEDPAIRPTFEKFERDDRSREEDCKIYPKVFHSNMGLSYYVAIKKHTTVTQKLGQLNTFLQKEDRAAAAGEEVKYLDQGTETTRIKQKVIPPPQTRWRFTTFFNLLETNVVILGQDPYPCWDKDDYNDGLAFSYNGGTPFPKSLRAIVDALKNDKDLSPSFTDPSHGRLDCWANQGVLLIDTVLSIEHKFQPGNHKNQGWEEITDAILTEIWVNCKVVFLLWGGKARERMSGIKARYPLSSCQVIETYHPAYDFKKGGRETKPFKNSKCFSECNKKLQEMEKKQINWQIE